MSIRRHGSRWQVRVRIGGGARVERTLPPGARASDARALETQIRRTHIDAAVGRRPRYLIDEALDRWVETSAKHLRSWPRDIRYRVDVLRGYTAGRPLEEIPAVAERVALVGRREGLQPASVNRVIALLRRVGNLAEKWGWTDLPIGRRVQMLAERSERHVYLSPAELQRLAAHADARTADLIRFAALSGLRLGELLGLRPGMIRDGTVLIDARSKSGRPRAVPLPPEALRIAQERLSADGWGVGRDALRTRFLRAREAAGLAHVRWHDLRHTYASWLVQAGQPLTAVRDLLGHSTLAVTTRYAHLAPAHLRQAVGALPSLQGGDSVGTGRRRRKRANR